MFISCEIGYHPPTMLEGLPEEGADKEAHVKKRPLLRILLSLQAFPSFADQIAKSEKKRTNMKAQVVNYPSILLGLPVNDARRLSMMAPVSNEAVKARMKF